MVGDVSYRFATFQLDATGHRLLHQGKVIHLAPRDFALLEYLLENTGRVLDRETILKTVWQDRIVEDGNLTQSISVLRHVLSEDAAAADCIETIPKHGYRFTLPVKRTERLLPSPRDRRIRVLRWLAAAVLLAISVLGSYWLGITGWPEGYFAIHEVGILPMENLTGDPRLDAVCEGSTDDIADVLASVPGLSIVLLHPNSAQKLEATRLARNLRLDAVLHSSIQPCEGALCISAELQHARSAGPIWSTCERVAEVHPPDRFPHLVSAVQAAVAARVPSGIAR
jgi:DNA-binding winged helix-turn-helix (wHTH) protein/TolB-like protein